MPKKISQLPDAILPLDGTEYIEIVQRGVSRRVQISNLPGGSTPTPPTGDRVLMETGDFILTETGDRILLE